MSDFSPPPYRKAIALIRNFDTGNMLRWLAVYNKKSRSLNFVSGDRLDGESFREAIMREVAWQLDVSRNDFLTSQMAQLNLEFLETLPHASIEMHYHVAFYNVEAYRPAVIKIIQSRTELAWVTSEEICNGRTKLGVPFDPTLSYLINRSAVIQHWESAASQREM
jgi:hypothetical protein